MNDSSPEPKPPPRRPKVKDHAHGWTRASDSPSTAGTSILDQRRRLRAPAGTSFLLALAVSVLIGIGIVRVRASTRILERGAQITELTDQLSELLEQRRRLSAERAYLRHPDQIEELARDRLGMVPIAPELVQEIRLKEKAP